MSDNKPRNPNPSYQPIIGRTGAPTRTQKFDPVKLKGTDLSKVMTIQGTAPVKRIKNFTMPGMLGQNPIPVVVVNAPTYPLVVTFRTGFYIVPTPLVPGAAACIVIGRAEGSSVPDTLGNLDTFPLSLYFADEHEIVVRPGEIWYAGSATPNAILTVIEKSILLLQ